MSDVFISFSYGDEEWVEVELRPQLEDAGLSVWRRDQRPGESIQQAIQRAISETRKIVLVLTPDYVESGWPTQLERMVSASNHLVVPLLKRPCRLPPFLAQLTYVDFTADADKALAWRQLLTALGAAPYAKEAPTLPDWYIAHPQAGSMYFTGRETERRVLTRWLSSDSSHPILILRAPGGSGKSALVWHWLLNDVDRGRWRRVMWWSFYENATFEAFVAAAFEYLVKSEPDDRLSPREQLEKMLEAIHSSHALLILDGFERTLRSKAGLDAADSVERESASPLASIFLTSVAAIQDSATKVLLTTRLLPAALEAAPRILLNGCREEQLAPLAPEDAVSLLRASGVRGASAELATVCEAYGNNPLALQLVAGLIARDSERPGDVAAARRLDTTGDLGHRQRHVIEQTYDTLSQSQQQLLGIIACFRASAPYDLLKPLALPNNQLDEDLHELSVRALIEAGPKPRHFSADSIVKRYAYERMPEHDRRQKHHSLLEYFRSVDVPEKPRVLDELSPALEAYHHMVAGGLYDEALDFFTDRLQDQLGNFGSHALIAELLRALFVDGDDAPPRMAQHKQAFALNSLALAYGRSGQRRRAEALFRRTAAIDEVLKDETSLAHTLMSLAMVSLRPTGRLREATAMLDRVAIIAVNIDNMTLGAIAAEYQARLAADCGAWQQADEAVTHALRASRELRDPRQEAWIWGERLRRELLFLRGIEADAKSRELIERALQGATELPNRSTTNCLLGSARRVLGDRPAAEMHLLAALEQCRHYNVVVDEPDILIELARLRVDEERLEVAQAHANEALLIATRIDNVLQAADAHLVLADIAGRRNETASARNHASAALKLAHCDGPPDYTYKAAYVEAQRILAGIPDGTEDIRSLADSNESVARLLVSMVAADTTCLPLLVSPSTALFLDALRKQQADRMPALADFLSRNRDSGAAHPLWLAWVIRIHRERLAEIGRELVRIAGSGGDAPRAQT